METFRVMIVFMRVDLKKNTLYYAITRSQILNEAPEYESFANAADQ